MKIHLLTTKSSNNYEMFNMHKVSSVQKRTEKEYLQWMRAMKKDYTFQVFHHHHHRHHHNSIVLHHHALEYVIDFSKQDSLLAGKLRLVYCCRY